LWQNAKLLEFQDEKSHHFAENERLAYFELAYETGFTNDIRFSKAFA
jgi:hypothetical protein